jgi:hypothetical protein
MFVRNTNGFDLPDRQFETFQTLLNFPARDARIDQHSFILIANVIAIAITSRTQRGYEHRHDAARYVIPLNDPPGCEDFSVIEMNI